MVADEVLINLIRLNGRSIDCERAQREAFLLSRCGAAFELTFVYRNGGPYSSEFVTAWDNMRTDNRITYEKEETRHGTPYLVYSRKATDQGVGTMVGLSVEAARYRLTRMSAVSDLVLELAAAYVYLTDDYGERAMDELRVRKPLTTTGDRTQQALELVEELGLSLATA